MNQADRVPDWIDQINCAAVGHINTKTNSPPIRNQPVAAGETFVTGEGGTRDADFIPVDLLGRDKRRGRQTIRHASFSMHGIQPLQRLGLIVRHLHAGNAECETMNDIRQRAQRREMFNRKLSFAHLLPVVRVVRVVVVVV